MTDAPSTFLTRGNGHVTGGEARARGAPRLTASIATGDMLDVRRFQVEERMSALFEVKLVAVSDNPDIDFEAVVGLPMRFEARGGPGERGFTGICRHLRQIAVEEKNLSTYELTLVPALWLLTQRRNHRMFQHRSEIDIVREVLSGWGISPTLKLGGTYRKRKYRVQYGESDYAFVARLLEDAGVSFYFEDGALVLDDAPHHNAARDPIAFRDNPLDTDQPHVTRVSVGRRLRPGKVTVRDHDHRRPPGSQLLQSAGVGGVEGALERFDYAPGAFVIATDKGDSTPHADDKGKYRADEDEGRRLAERRLEAGRASAWEISFLTNVIDPAPGAVLSFLDHPKRELGPDRRLLVVASRLSGEVPGPWTHAVSAVSAAAPYRPALRTKKPRARGVESATVVGPPGEEIHVDEHGRVRVHFHWDRESRMNDASSCWIPVSQSWGGAGFGSTNLPRVGQEVVVDFLGGDPDRPIIVGRVHTGVQRTPYPLPEHKTRSGWKSRSTPATGGYNEIMFEDSAGRELVHLRAERDMTTLVQRDHTGRVGNDLREEVARDERRVTGGDRERLVQQSERVTIGESRERVVGKSERVTIGESRERVVGRSERVAIGENSERVVKQNERVEVGEHREHVVGRTERITVGEDRAVTVARSQSTAIGMDGETTIGGNMILQMGQDGDIIVGQSLSKNVAEMEREATGLHRSMVVGGNLTTEVGFTGSVTVGQSFHVEVTPPQRLAAGKADREGSGPTSLTMTHEKIVLTTGTGATITLEGAEVRIEADTIKLFAAKSVEADAREEHVALHAGKDITLRADDGIHAGAGAGGFKIETTSFGYFTVKANGMIQLDAHDTFSAQGMRCSVLAEEHLSLKSGVATLLESMKEVWIGSGDKATIESFAIDLNSGYTVVTSTWGEIILKSKKGSSRAIS